MKVLTVDRIIGCHRDHIARCGGDGRIISEANLHELVFRANLVKDPIIRASLVLYSLVAYPAFREGNEAAGLALAEAILEEEGYSLDPAGLSGLSRLADGVREFSADLPDIEAWLSNQVRKDS